tara:strand:+ start:92 stop:580 length:489 start_codon:yes stop_codon:yes gene_type:complete
VLFLDKNLRRISIAIIDEKNDEITPIVIGKISINEVFLYNKKSSTIPEIEIAGIPIRKDNLAAVRLSISENNAEVKVTPDLETPGNIARHCDIPKKIISRRLICANDFSFLPNISERASKIAITIETIAIDNKPLKYESENPGQNSLINKPTINIGRLAMKI